MTTKEERIAAFKLARKCANNSAYGLSFLTEPDERGQSVLDKMAIASGHRKLIDAYPRKKVEGK
jgi:hypothetical protein